MQKSDGTATVQWGTTIVGDHVLFDAEVLNADIIFRTSGNNTRMLTDGSTGNVGIGTDTPIARLHVVGDMLTKAVYTIQ